MSLSTRLVTTPFPSSPHTTNFCWCQRVGLGSPGTAESTDDPLDLNGWMGWHMQDCIRRNTVAKYTALSLITLERGLPNFILPYVSEIALRVVTMVTTDSVVVSSFQSQLYKFCSILWNGVWESGQFSKLIMTLYVRHAKVAMTTYPGTRPPLGSGHLQLKPAETHTQGRHVKCLFYSCSYTYAPASSHIRPPKSRITSFSMPTCNPYACTRLSYNRKWLPLHFFPALGKLGEKSQGTNSSL